MKPIEFIHGTNTTQDVVRQNVEWCMAHASSFGKLEDRRCVIVGGGPSAKSPAVQAKLLHPNKGDVFALNQAWRLVDSYAVEVDYVVMMDAREENVDFVFDLPKCDWLVASQCSPVVFEKLRDLDQSVKVWHAAGSEVVEDLGLRAIPGGGTVLSRAINIAYRMGYGHITLAGVDSSHEGEKHHAYSQPLNDGEKRIGVATPSGTEFVTTAELAEQANTVMNQMLTLERVGITFEVLGDGLLPALWREHNELRADPEKWEPEKYRRAWERPEYRKSSPAMNLMDEICSHLGFNTHHVIDFGCGEGKSTAELIRRGYSATGVDFAANAISQDVPHVIANLWSLPEDVNGDAGICIDVMEHLPPEKVDAALANIARAVPLCVFHIESAPDAMGVIIGERLHLSVHSQRWWIEKLKEYFDSVEAIENLIVCKVKK